jgi:hypothetical protein
MDVRGGHVGDLSSPTTVLTSALVIAITTFFAIGFRFE